MLARLENTNVRKRATKFCLDSNYVFMLSHITVPHIDMASVIFNILTPQTYLYFHLFQDTMC